MLTLKRRLSALRVRYIIKYTKESNIKFISHLDMQRTMQRTIRRSGLPVQYSKGFNPHIEMSIAQPLGVGVYSSGEYFDLMMEEELDEKEVIDRLNKCSASGIKYLSAKKLILIDNERKIPRSMALIDACRYTIKIKYKNIDSIENEINELLKSDNWTTLKKSKKSERLVNIKPFVFDFKFWIKDNYLVLNTLLRSGSKEHLAADVLINFIKENTSEVDNEAFVDVKREEMYYYKGEKLEPLYNYRQV